MALKDTKIKILNIYMQPSTIIFIAETVHLEVRDNVFTNPNYLKSGLLIEKKMKDGAF